AYEGASWRDLGEHRSSRVRTCARQGTDPTREPLNVSGPQWVARRSGGGAVAVEREGPLPGSLSQVKPVGYATPAAFSVARTRAGVSGAVRIRTPVASKKAFAIAAGIESLTGSPIPIGGPGRWTTTGVTLGWSLKRRMGYVTQSSDVTLLRVYRSS